MTQTELADALGINQSQVSRYCKRGMPVHDLAAAKDWISRHVRLTMKAALYRRQTRAMPRHVAAPPSLSVAGLVELAEGIGQSMVDPALPPAFDEGLGHLVATLGALARLDEAAVARVRLPQRCSDAVQAFLAAP